MRLHETVWSRWSRGCAAGLLLVWVAAQALCFAHCNFSSPTQSTASAETAVHRGSCCPKKAERSASNVCVTLKSALNDSSAQHDTALFPPRAHALIALVDALECRASDATQIFFRQQAGHERMFTPEVCLGPAFRSHAPPVLA
jgi:hypothetical protein